MKYVAVFFSGSEEEEVCDEGLEDAVPGERGYGDCPRAVRDERTGPRGAEASKRRLWIEW